MFAKLKVALAAVQLQILGACGSLAAWARATFGQFVDPDEVDRIKHEARAGGVRSVDRGQSNLVELMIGLLLAGIIAMAVFIPVWTSVLNDVASNLSSTQETIADLIPLFIIILILVAAVSPLRRRFS